MSTLTLALPEEDLKFLRAFARQQGTSAEEFLALQAKHLREHMQRPIAPDIRDATGIIDSGVEGADAHLAHVEKKHG